MGSNTPPDGHILPTFLVIGAMKAGTTALHRYLDAHPQVFASEPKELDFFVTNWDRGLGWYAEHFADANGFDAIGESSPNYTKRHDHPETVARLADVVPDVRLVYVVRDPVERIVSMYRHAVADGIERARADVAVLENPDYVLTSSYAFQLQPYVERFGRDRLLVIDSDGLRRNRLPTMERVARHIGVDPALFPAESLEPEVNRTSARRSESRLGLRLRRIGAYHRTLNRSWRLREAHVRVFSRKVRPVSGPSEATLAEVARRLRPDVAEFVAMGVLDGADGWGLLDDR